VNAHPITSVILRALVPGEGGLQLDAKKRTRIVDAMQGYAKANDAQAVAAFYGVIGLLSQGGAPKAAESLMGMIFEADAVPKVAKTGSGGWAR
jgi:hypothetical protein